MSSTSSSGIKVLVTGFGPFLDIGTNPSWSIAQLLPASLTSANNTPIQLIIPKEPVPAAYHKLLTLSSSLIAQHEPHIVLHIGLAFDRDYFAVEQSAPKEGYHDVPDIDRKVLTRAENKKLFGKSPSELKCELDLEGAAAAWQSGCAHLRPKGQNGEKGKQPSVKVDVRLSDDVGTYVCGLIFYNSMTEMQKRTGRRDAVFLHVPPLNGDEEVKVGTEVTKNLIIALADVWEAR